MNENEHLIELIAIHTKTLLQNHWPDIMSFRNDGNGDSIKIGFSHDLSYEGQERIVESTISFGKRIKDSTIDRIDTQQLNFDLHAVQGNKRSRKTKSAVSAEDAESETPNTESLEETLP